MAVAAILVQISIQNNRLPVWVELDGGAAIIGADGDGDCNAMCLQIVAQQAHGAAHGAFLVNFVADQEDADSRRFRLLVLPIRVIFSF